MEQSLLIKCAYDELVPIENLVPNPDNNNRHSIEQIEQLAKIMKFQGIRKPIYVSKRSGFITAGHLRLEALKLLGVEKIPVDFQEYENEAQEYADLTADNELAKRSEFDWHQHYTIMEQKEFDIELEYFGLTSDSGNTNVIDDLLEIENLEGSSDKCWFKVLCKNEDELNEVKEKLNAKSNQISAGLLVGLLK
jgi:hypothetical protein